MGIVRLALRLLLGPPVFLLALASAAAALAAQRGRTSLRLDLLAHFAPLWLAGAVTAAMLAVILFRGVSRLLVLALAGAGMVAAGALMLPEYTRDTGPKAPASAPGQVKIVQFNVWNENRDLDRTVDWLVSQHPDIVVLEETTPPLRRLIERRTGWRSVCRDCEVMIYSSRPMARGYTPAAPAVGPLSHAVFKDAEGTFDLVGVHDAWPTDGGDQQRQEARLAHVLADLPKDRTIVTGDFNSTPWSFERRKWDAAFGLIRRDRAIFTWPAGKFTSRRIKVPFPILPIDHLYAGAAWATVDIHRGPVLGSDHYPVVLTLAPVAPSKDAPPAPRAGLQIEK